MKRKLLLIMILFSVLFLFIGCADVAYKKAIDTNSIEAYNQFISKYPDSEFAPQAKERSEELYWQQMKKQNLIISYESYLEKYPSGKYAKAAEVKIEDVVWDSSKTNQNYEEYLQRYPAGKYAKEGKKRIEEIVFIRDVKKGDIIGVNNFLNKYQEVNSLIKAQALFAAFEGASDRCFFTAKNYTITGFKRVPSENRVKCFKVAKRLIDAGFEPDIVRIMGYELAGQSETKSGLNTSSVVMSGDTATGAYIDYDPSTGLAKKYSTGNHGEVDLNSTNGITLKEYASREGLTEFIALLKTQQ